VNLVEQLGGYEKALQFLKSEMKSLEIDPVFYLDGQEILIDVLDDALLEYRRQHNIFEDSDKIVWISPQDQGHLYTVKDITPTGYSYGNDWGWYRVISTEGVGYSFRHATDAEIEAGKRLEVS